MKLLEEIRKSFIASPEAVGTGFVDCLILAVGISE